MITASAWKNFLRAFKVRVGMRLSAASNNSFATADTFALFGNVGSAGRERPREFDRWLWAGVTCSDDVGGSTAVPV